MPSRHPLLPARVIPRIWLFTDERMAGDPLTAARALPPRSGIIFRHYRTAAPHRIRLIRQLRRIAQARGHVFLMAGSAADAARIGADGNHVSLWRGGHGAERCFSTGAHNATELERAIRSQAAIVFVSPVFATRSHIGGGTLGIRGFERLARHLAKRSAAVAIALGGMDADGFVQLRRHGAHGWGAIDALDTPEAADSGN